jgi:hypothetical protein
MWNAVCGLRHGCCGRRLERWRGASATRERECKQDERSAHVI